MYITPINTQIFKGKTRYLSCNSEGKGKTVSDCPFGTASFGETRGLSDFVKKHSYPNASVEETVGKFHDNKTYRVYVASPKEVVSDVIRKNHDYVVYDREPVFPDIHSLYFSSDIKIVNKGFKDVLDYLERLADSGMMTSSALLKKRQVVNDCVQIYNEGSDLIKQKKMYESKIISTKKDIEDIKKNIPIYEKELAKKRMSLANHEKCLKGKENKLDSFEYKRILLKEKINRTPEEVEYISKKISEYKEKICEKKFRIKNYQTRIEFLECYLSEAPQKIADCESNIKAFEALLIEIKKSMMPKFKKLCDFYTVNGIKIIQKI